ncbi:glycogen/starch synthase [Luteolibacter sp. SL250]|uniref:glycogen synthase n=1 Tax=Luteolibacter sp. SL250 TaxID=2995170 RepID=UPI002271CF14|nr:glycogen/starch synthase [Luteolibacter sp. SL250]WAC19383.1 glycogen/starch synthase [Luteolibacter sp. SL250]
MTPELNSSSSLWLRGGKAPRAKAGGLADMCTLLVDSLSERGADVHVAMPHFRSLFREEPMLSRRLHLCQDREFYYRRSVYEGGASDNRRAALVFQRDVIHHVLPQVRPDIVHCHDWMTGLVPAAARKMGMKSIFTIHNLHDEQATLAEIEDRGIDAARFWDGLHYQQYPESYVQSRSWNQVSFLPSAVHAADHVNTVSRSFLHELMDGRHAGTERLNEVLRAKHSAGCASGIINAPDATWNPESDPALVERYGASTHAGAKAANKAALQKACGLEVNPSAPLLFWPSRLDPVQKGCQLLADILYQVTSDHAASGLQVVFVADGPYKRHFEHIADFHGLRHRIAVCQFDETLSRLAFGASDFVMMPSSYEPCGLAQMVGLKYGSLPIVHRTGGLQDTVEHLSPDSGAGNGFVFENHDAGGLRWAIQEAMRFHRQPDGQRHGAVERIMRQSQERFAPASAVDSYVGLFEKLLGRSLQGETNLRYAGK